MALCAIAVLSFSTAGVARADFIDPPPPPPIDDEAAPLGRCWWIAKKLPADILCGAGPVDNGTFIGTVMID